MKQLKVEVKNLSDANEVQELFEKLGYEKDFFDDCDYPRYVVTEARQCGNWISTGADMGYKKGKTINMGQLKDLVVLHRNDVKDATHKHIGGAAAYKTVDEIAYFWTRMGWEYKGVAHDLVPIHKETEQGLISGADAKLAWANGEELLIDSGTGFHDLTDNYYLAVFDRDSNKFKRKPRNIKLELEIPTNVNMSTVGNKLIIDFNNRDNALLVSGLLKGALCQ